MNRWAGATLILMALLVFDCTKNKEQGSAPATITEGDKAPLFKARDLTGKEVNLAGLQGKVVLVTFWATWCPPCRAEIPSMVRLNEIMAGKPFQMLAISVDEGGREEIEDFFKRKGVSLPTLIDKEQQVAKLYGVTGIPRSFIIDKQGIVRRRIAGGLDWSAPETVNYLTNLSAR